MCSGQKVITDPFLVLHFELFNSSLLKPKKNYSCKGSAIIQDQSRTEHFFPVTVIPDLREFLLIPLC